MRALSPVHLRVCVSVCPRAPNLASKVPGTLDVNRSGNEFGTQGCVGVGAGDGLLLLSSPKRGILLVCPLYPHMLVTSLIAWYERGARPQGLG